MKFTAVVVTYNRIKLLKECLEHLERQTVPVEKIIIMDNYSDDGTEAFLKNYINNNKYIIYRNTENMGGAYGFYKGLEIAMDLDCNWVLLIDDDAILDENYFYHVQKHIVQDQQKYQAYSGTVYTDGRIYERHRVRNRYTKCFCPKGVRIKEYRKDYFLYDYATFCGLLIKKELITKVGLPLKEYFLWDDDSEYGIRLRKYTQCKNVNAAFLNHKAKAFSVFSYKKYYGTRNRIDLCKRHFNNPVGISYCMVKMYVRLLVDVCRKIIKCEFTEIPYVIRLYLDAIHDGKTGRLGKNERYLPNQK